MSPIYRMVWVLRPLKEHKLYFWDCRSNWGIVFSMGLYAKNYITLANWKKNEKWTKGQVNEK